MLLIERKQLENDNQRIVDEMSLVSQQLKENETDKAALLADLNALKEKITMIKGTLAAE